MADKAGVVVKGAKRLRRTLKQAGDDLSDLKAAHLAAATIAAQAAKSRAPIGKTRKTVGSIRPGATKTAAIIRAGRNNMPWVGRVHYGDPASVKAKAKRLWARVTRDWKRSGRIQPHTYLTDGAQASEPAWTPIYQRALDKAIDKIQGA